VSRRTIGLALGGGVARGPAHLGVLEVLERESIPVDIVAGASAGSLVGALYCAGISAARGVDLLAHFGWRAIARPVRSRLGLLSFDKLRAWLENVIGPRTFEGLAKRLVVVATDIETGEAVTLQSGPVALAVQASCAVQGLVMPVWLDGRWLGDGSVSACLPVQAARAAGADLVIGVDLFAPKIRPNWGPMGVAFAAVESMVQRSGGGLNCADCLVAPAVAGTSYVRFDRAEEMVRLGRAAVEAQLPAIRVLLAGST
jgi:NTE family protein